MNRNKLFHNCQHGFRNGRSCNTQLLEVTEDWTKMLDNSIPVDCVYLDYQKAFDSVPHRRLLVKMKTYDIVGKIYTWIEIFFFLSNRKQRVKVNGEK